MLESEDDERDETRVHKEGEKPFMSVSVSLVLSKAYAVYGYYKTLKSFVEDQMATFLKSMGEIQYDSAIQHLENSKRAPAKRKEYVLLAIGDLENAYRAFELSAPKGVVRFLKENIGNDTLGGNTERAKAYEKACATVILQSMCYKYLGDSANSKLYIKKAIQFFEIYAEAEENAFTAKNSTFIPGTPGFSSPKNYPPSESQMKEFRKRIESQRKNLEAIARK